MCVIHDCYSSEVYGGVVYLAIMGIRAGVIRLCCINVQLLDDFERHVGVWKNWRGNFSNFS